MVLWVSLSGCVLDCVGGLACFCLGVGLCVGDFCSLCARFSLVVKVKLCKVIVAGSLSKGLEDAATQISQCPKQRCCLQALFGQPLNDLYVFVMYVVEFLVTF